ncbi:hypothetical protein PISMIDRAFT_530582 [Pisolithus microcarpus 441]|uniref:Uncharacterized protein n=1 Tax=Pisolithus microcarpus 441 TaxID=765257 RepID=A0A0C9YAZ6_9AGAM|nr:hypothetical protein PISMIDRAFT_530582 [Pisolithus microcarpus 441]
MSYAYNSSPKLPVDPNIIQCAWFTSYYEINYCLFRHIAPRSVKAGSRPCPRFPPLCLALLSRP